VPTVPEAVVEEADLARATVRGLAWTAGSRIGQQGLVVVGTAVLARLLTPGDFGLVAMIAIFVGFVAVFGDLGLPSALVHRRELTQVELTSAFWLTTGTAVAIAAVFAAAAPLVAALYDQSELLALTPVIALSLPIGALSAVHAGLTQRKLDFRTFAVVEIGATAVAYAAAIAAALAGAGVWSLVALSLVRAVVETTTLWVLVSWRPTRQFERAAARRLLHFGGNLAGAGSVAYWINNADNLLVGVFVGQRGLGYYSRAFTLMQAPLAQASWAAQRVMFPALSRLRDDVPRVKRTYLRAITLIAFVAFPLVTALVIAAEPLVLTLLGPDWRGAIELFRILAPGGMLQAVATTGSWLFLSQGRTDWLFRWNLVNAPLTVAAFAIGVHWGAVGVAWAFLIRTIVITPPSFMIPGRLVGLRAAEVARALAPIVGACIVVAVVLVPADRAFSGTPALVWLALDLFVAAGVYAGLTAALRLRGWRELRSLAAAYRGRPAAT
jgi:O-antigen/teichoic acid export membrane protein